MARTDAINIFQSASVKEKLAELYGKVVENIQKTTISGQIKNTDLSGDPAAGSVEAKRFVNSVPATYGTARSAAKGTALTVTPVTVNLNTHKEIVEEVNATDMATYGVDGILARRANNHALRMAADLERAFLSAAASAAVTSGTSATDIEEVLEDVIQKCETVSDNFVDGVPRSMMNLVVTPAVYGQIRNYLDKTVRANVDTAAEEFYAFHGVRVFSSTYLPSSLTDGILLIVDGAVAQPVRSVGYDGEKIPLSNDYGIELFYDYGTAVVASDLIFKK